jgi:hypothetical protein
MSVKTRRTLAALVALFAIVAGALPAAAASNGGSRSHEEASNAPLAVDILVLRPVGFVTLALGACLFVVSAPFTLVTRPLEIGKPFKHFVVRPAKYLWADPLGGH